MLLQLKCPLCLIFWIRSWNTESLGRGWSCCSLWPDILCQSLWDCLETTTVFKHCSTDGCLPQTDESLVDNRKAVQLSRAEWSGSWIGSYCRGFHHECARCEIIQPRGPVIESGLRSSNTARMARVPPLVWGTSYRWYASTFKYHWCSEKVRWQHNSTRTRSCNPRSIML